MEARSSGAGSAVSAQPVPKMPRTQQPEPKAAAESPSDSEVFSDDAYLSAAHPQGKGVEDYVFKAGVQAAAATKQLLTSRFWERAAVGMMQYVHMAAMLSGFSPGVAAQLKSKRIINLAVQ